MKPDSTRNQRRKLTPRQLDRRRQLPQTNQQISSESKVIRFGKQSQLISYSDRVMIEIYDCDINDTPQEQIANVLNLRKTPFLGPKKISNIDELYKLIPARRKMLHFAIFMNNIRHYSGGRYYLVWIAHLLAEMGHQVTVITDNKPLFLDDFKYMDIGNRVEWVYGTWTDKTQWFVKAPENFYFDIIIESPLARGGFIYAKKFELPLFAVLFESPNYVAKYRGGSDSTEEYWWPYKHGIAEVASSVICISNVAMQEAKEWLTKKNGNRFDVDYSGKFDLVQPCINTYAADRIEDQEVGNEIVFVGRHVEFKNPNEIVLAVAKISEDIRPIINFVGSHSSKVREKMIETANTLNVKIRFYANVNDEQKFQIIKRSKLLVFSSNFEGFGIPPAEALYAKKPVIAYDIPVLRQDYGDTIEYVKPNDVSSLGKRIEELLIKDERAVEIGEKGYESFFLKDKPIPCLPSYMKKNLRKTFYGSKNYTVTAGMIVLNGADTIKLALRSIYDFVDKIVICEGAVEDYAKNNPELVSKGSEYNSIDATDQHIKLFPDPFHKIIHIAPPDDRFWKNKNEMQNAIAEHIDTDLYLKVDSDEIFTESDVEYMKRYFMTDDDLWVIQILKHEFWKTLDTVATGGQWSRPQARMWRWRSDFRHPLDAKTGFNYYIDKDGVQVKNPNYKSLNLMEKLCYHLGYARSEKHILGKINYYANRGIESNVIDTFTGWKEGMPTNPTHSSGTTAEKFVGELPPVLRKGFFDKHSVEIKEKLENNLNIMSSPVKNK